MATFGVLDDVKLGLHNTFEKMRYKLQKNASKMMASSNGDRSAGEYGGGRAVSYDYYCPISQSETAPLDDSGPSNAGSNDIGLLPLERDSSCLQEVLELENAARNNRSATKAMKSPANNLSNNLVDAFSSKVSISNNSSSVLNPSFSTSSSSNSGSSRSEACLVDLNEAEPASSQPILAPPLAASSGRSFSAVHLEAPPIQRSASLSSPSQHQDFFDLFTSPRESKNASNLIIGGFANFGNNLGNGAKRQQEEEEESTLKPVLVGSFASNTNGGSESKDPFASILGDFQPHQQSQNVPKPKQKVTLGALVSNRNSDSGPVFVSPGPFTQQQSSKPFSSPSFNNASSTPFLSGSSPRLGSQQTTPPQNNNNNSNGQKPTGSSAAAQSQSQSQSSSFNLGFDDVFDQLGFSRQNSGQGQRTMRDMRKDLLAKELADDPEALKVRHWVDGKQGNIRALLSTLDQILWDDESRSKWEPIPIHQLVKASEVRKAYKRAVVVCHPDKLVGTQYERISRLVFVELNEASTEFQKELEKTGAM